ncbi:hypothetical protein HU200_043554 [Digitaria exilis]|uniref:Uncharacterized protein n=1 Tax=Digitaria exilis TaxID=1010633 RepID=A0A835EG93_9POAL|nr:hypothetical protein HU200_043554 [Digitaria exilis]
MKSLTEPKKELRAGCGSIIGLGLVHLSVSPRRLSCRRPPPFRFGRYGVGVVQSVSDSEKLLQATWFFRASLDLPLPSRSLETSTVCRDQIEPMGSVLSGAYAALCSLVGALIDKAEMRELRAANPHLSAEELENFWRWIRDQDAEQDARDAARRYLSSLSLSSGEE